MPRNKGKQDSRYHPLSPAASLGANGPRGRRNLVTLVVLVIAGVYFIEDIYSDYVLEGSDITHVLIEAAIFIAVLLALWSEMRSAFRLSVVLSKSERMNRLLRRHFHEIIRDEFIDWRLTPAEQETALLLIKGLSMQEIAAIRGVKEKSVRQQSTGIYTKAKVSNRYELSASLIEDLLAVEIQSKSA